MRTPRSSAGRADVRGEPTGQVSGGTKRRLRSQSGDSLRDLPDLRLILDGPKGSPDIFQAFHATPRVDAVFDEIGGLVRGVERTVQVTGLLIGQSQGAVTDRLVAWCSLGDRAFQRLGGPFCLPRGEEEAPLRGPELRLTEPGQVGRSVRSIDST